MKRAFSLVLAFLLAVAAGPVRGDVVTDWNLTAIDVMKAARFGGNPAARTLAMVHVAMSDAVNTVQNRYTRYLTTVPMAAVTHLRILMVPVLLKLGICYWPDY